MCTSIFPGTGQGQVKKETKISLGVYFIKGKNQQWTKNVRCIILTLKCSREKIRQKKMIWHLCMWLKFTEGDYGESHCEINCD